MTEEEARAWVADGFGAAATDRLTRFAEMLVTENARQNLIAPSTIPTIWSRHLADSVQLAQWGGEGGSWVDIGTGGGLPGLVLALLVDRPFRLVEPRRLRAAFLSHCVDAFGLSSRVEVQASRIETVTGTAATISARAVTGLDLLIASARHLSTRDTIWILPRGQSGAGEVQASFMRSRATFHVEPSLTDPEAVILIATGISAA